MNTLVDLFRKLFNRFVGNDIEVEIGSGDVIVTPSVSVKRRLDENNYEDTCLKKRKIFSSVSGIDCNDSSLPWYSTKKSQIGFQKENRQMASEYSKKQRNKSARTNVQQVYCIDDGDCIFRDKLNRKTSVTGLSPKLSNNKHDQPKFVTNDDCVVVGETRRAHIPSLTDVYSKLSCNKMQRIREHSTFLSMMRNECPFLRKNPPLTNSTVHNTKQNRQLFADSTVSRSYFFRSRQIHSAKLNSPMLQELSSENNESIFDKIVIDLTSSEDDEDQRQAIESKIISSPEMRDMKSSFVGENTFALSDDLISTLTKKYDTRIQGIKKRATEVEKTIEHHRNEVNKTISEILEQRLTLKEHEEEKDKHLQKPSKEVAPITKEMISEINGILGSRKTILVQIKDTSVKIQDIRTLENTSWLNDEIINAYMNLIKQRSEENPNKYPKVYCFNTFLYEQLSRKGYISVRRWTRKVDIFDFEILIIPIHLSNHWCLIQILFAEKCIFYYDSMGSPNNRCLNTMIQYLTEEYRDKKNGTFDASDWRLSNVSSDTLPQQKNAHDCGVFACTFAEHITRRAPFNFDQDDMRYFRVKMMYEILTGRLLL